MSVNAIYLQDITKTFLYIKIVLHWKCIYRKHYVASAKLNQQSVVALWYKRHVWVMCAFKEERHLTYYKIVI